jgi:hypothetical protein
MHLIKVIVLGSFLSVFYPAVGLADFTPLQLGHMADVRQSPDLVQDSKEVLSHLEGIILKYRDILGHIEGAKTLEDPSLKKGRLNLLQDQKRHAEFYASNIGKSSSKKVIQEVFRLTNVEDPIESDAAWRFIEQIVSKGGNRNPLIFAELIRQIDSLEHGPTSGANYHYALVYGVARFDEPPLEKHANTIIWQALTHNLSEEKGSERNSLAQSAAISLGNRALLTVGDVDNLVDLLKIKDIQSNVANEIARSIHQHSWSNIFHSRAVFQAIGNRDIPDSVKARLLLNPQSSTIWERNHFLDYFTGTSKKEAKKMLDSSTEIFTLALASDSSALRLAVLDQVFAQIVIYGVKNKELVAAVKRQLTYRDPVVRQRAWQLYSAALEVSPAFQVVLRAPDKLGFERQNTAKHCMSLIAKSFRTKEDLTAHWNAAKQRHSL